MNRILCITCVIFLAACGGENNASNNTSPPPKDMQMSAADMGKDEMGAPDLAGEVDMGTPPESAADCEATEWFSTDGPSCNACPAQALACSGLVAEKTEISASDNFFSVAFDTALIEVQSVQLFYNLYVIVPETIDEPEYIVMTMEDDEMKELGDQYVISPDVAFNYTGDFDLLYIVVTDKCGTEHRVDLEGSWNANDGEITTPFACVSP